MGQSRYPERRTSIGGRRVSGTPVNVYEDAWEDRTSIPPGSINGGSFRFIDGDPGETEYAAQARSSARNDVARAPKARAMSVDPVDRALDEALVHAPRRAGASYAHVIATIQERTGLDEETAWAMVGRALARSGEVTRGTDDALLP